MKTLTKLLKLLAIPTFIIYSTCSLFPAPKVEKSDTQQETTIIDEEGEETPVQRNDIIMNFEFPSYNVGDNFDFYLFSQNVTENNLIIDNLNKKSLEYVLFKENNEVSKSPIPNKVLIRAYEYGTLEADIVKDEIAVTICNGEITYNGSTFKIPSPLSITKEEEIPLYAFPESGTYHLEFSVTYNVDGFEDVYKSTFISEEFEVN